ncbi:MAG TPA: hypothetical protein VKE40_05070 [Gemmataceae bacterium]|nr:hypothetical protein [Gemmataceae bacterium]
MRMFRVLGTVLLAAIVGCAKDPTAVPVREAEALAPGDLGIGKYVFEAKVPADKVLVLRHTEAADDKPADRVLESIQYTDGAVGREVVLVFDSSSFPFGDQKVEKVRVKTQAGDAHYGDRRVSGTARRPGQLVIRLAAQGQNEIVLTYDCFIEDYATAKKRVPDLPAAGRGEAWTHNTTYKPKK